MTKAYSYIRFSSPEQAKGRSQARQFEDCEAYCKKHNLELVKDVDYTFLDRGLSGYKSEHVGDKGQLKKFMELVDKGDIEPGSYLIIENLDRLGREDVNIVYDRLREITTAGINVVTLSDERVYRKDASLIDMIVSIISMARANEESSIKAQRVGDAWRKKQEDARTYRKPIGKAVPMWLKVTPEGFQIIEERAAVVRRIFQLAIDGYGKAVTAKALVQASPVGVMILSAFIRSAIA